ncbi:MAG TPA: hypothetical protein VK934_06220 [Fimbriimonas sp.]|nr:hypothetical protein [Fimbriimonas sp.]
MIDGKTYKLQNVEYFDAEEQRIVHPRMVSPTGHVTKLAPDSNDLRGRFVPWPFPGKLIAARGHAATSHHTWYYVLNGSGVHGPVAHLHSGLNGGPIFRDINHDGRKEMVFDNYSYYLDQPKGRLPDKFLVYRIGADGLPRFWKSVPNAKHEQLKDTTGFDSMPRFLRPGS